MARYILQTCGCAFQFYSRKNLRKTANKLLARSTTKVEIITVNDEETHKVLN